MSRRNPISLLRCVCLVPLLLLGASPIAAETFGVLGDSLNDEYLGTPDLFGTETDLPALNWVQLLAQLRGLDFGSFEANPGIRGEPRNEGYQHDWARAGAKAVGYPIFLPASSSVTSQAAALAPAVAAGAVDIVLINVGHNDYFYRDYLYFLDQTLGNNPELFVLDDPGYLAFEQGVFDAIFNAVDTILAAHGNARVLLFQLPPGTLGNVPYIVDAMAQLNVRLAAEVSARADPDLALVDIYDWGSARFDASDNLIFGPYLLAPGSKASLAQTTPGGPGPCDSAGNCATLDYALNLVCHDTPGGHPGTIMQGLFANEILEALAPWLGAPVALLSDNEVINAAAGTSLSDCDDWVDNDADGLVDFPEDPGCIAPTDASEREGSLPCDDGLDNDADGRIDFDPTTFANPGDATTLPAGQGDPGCRQPSWPTEAPACQNGSDDPDADAALDYDAGLSANGFADPAGPDPQCLGRPWHTREKPGSRCGLGFELTLLLALVVPLRPGPRRRPSR